VAKFRFPLRRKGGRPVRSSYTVLILPHSRSRFRKLHVSRAFVACAGAALLLLTGAGLYSPHLLLTLRTQSLELEELSARNEHLQQANAQFENRLAAVAERLTQFEQTAGRLAAGAVRSGGRGPVRRRGPASLHRRFPAHRPSDTRR